MENQQSIGLTSLSYRLPKLSLSLNDLDSQKKLSSSVDVLSDFGFKNCYVQEDHASFDEVSIEAGKEALDISKLKREAFESLFLYSGIDARAFSLPEEANKNPLNFFQYSSSKIRHSLELVHTNVLAVSQQGCSGLLSSINTAARLLQTSDKNAMLCIAADMLPESSPREILYNIMSDAAAAVVIEKGASKNIIIELHQHHQSYYWDTSQHADELLASYFPLAQRTIRTTIEKAGLHIEDIAWFVPHNVNLKSWTILADIIGVSMEKIWTKNISRIGHTVSCDHVINIVDMEKEGVLKKGDYLALFTFGFGASWSCMILQH